MKLAMLVNVAFLWLSVLLLVIFCIIMPSSSGISDRWQDPVRYKLLKAVFIYGASCMLLLLCEKVLR